MKNQELRNNLAERSIRYWELADAVGISPSLLSVWLRYELSGTRLNRVSAALDALTAACEQEGREDDAEC